MLLLLLLPRAIVARENGTRVRGHGFTFVASAVEQRTVSVDHTWKVEGEHGDKQTRRLRKPRGLTLARCDRAVVRLYNDNIWGCGRRSPASRAHAKGHLECDHKQPASATVVTRARGYLGLDLFSPVFQHAMVNGVTAAAGVWAEFLADPEGKLLCHETTCAFAEAALGSGDRLLRGRKCDEIYFPNGLANLVHCEPGTIVVEIMPEARARLYYAGVAYAKKLRFVAFAASRFAYDGPDIALDPVALARAVDLRGATIGGFSAQSSRNATPAAPSTPSARGAGRLRREEEERDVGLGRRQRAADLGRERRRAGQGQERRAARRRWAARALGYLAWSNAANKFLIAEAGGIAPLVELLRDGSAQAKEHATWVLNDLALDDNKALIAEAGGIPPLVELLRDGCAVAMHALRRLTLNNDATRSRSRRPSAGGRQARAWQRDRPPRSVVRNAGVPAKRKAALVVAALLRDCVRNSNQPRDIKAVIGSYLRASLKQSAVSGRSRAAAVDA
ncbi:hypothetical protein JL720_5703 [Aureococcus anophagefferens]|nr:hypothetical protein JL720_5703 [Aureococcus anophagefferens]